MVSVADLLNPEPPRAPLPSSRPIPPSPSRRLPLSTSEPVPVKPSAEILKQPENAKRPVRNEVKGVVNFPPFENLDEASLAQVRRFKVHPFGSIQDTCRLIPYISGKKDFFYKTGREGFEAFQYDFTIPGDNTPFTVMWDYNVGLVRMTPFFKCHGYSKTTPAKMLQQNPGLKDITYSITGGSIKAQGYWMPFSCAKAVCATFCHKIAGALIPLFGPQFPLECIPDKAVGHGRMVIDPVIVSRAKRDVATLFGQLPGLLPSPRPSRSLSPQPPPQRSLCMVGPYHQRPSYDRHGLLSPYGTDTDSEFRTGSEKYAEKHSSRINPTLPPLQTQTASGSPSIAGAPTPVHSPDMRWTTVNRPYPLYQPQHHPSAYYRDGPDRQRFVPAPALAAHPWLSAVPRSRTSPTSGPSSSSSRPLHTPNLRIQASGTVIKTVLKSPRPHSKRCFDYVDADTDEGYDAGRESLSLSQSSSQIESSPSSVTGLSDEGHHQHDHRETTVMAAKATHPTLEVQKDNASTDDDAFSNGADDESHGQNGSKRREAERDAAIMLMSMHSRSQTRPMQQQQHQEQDRRLGKEEVEDRSRAASPSRSSPQMKDTKIGGSGQAVAVTPPVSEEVSGLGPTTRSKRRRTLV